MKKFAAKFLSLLLVLSFVLTAFPLSVTANETAVIAEENEKEEVDYTDLYVRDVDGIEGDELVFLYDAFGKTAEDGAPTSITDHLGNTVKLPAGASYKDNALYLGGKALNLSSLYDKTKDIHFETVIEQTGEVVNISKVTYIGPYDVQLSTNTPVDESHGVVSGFYWSGANWGTDVSWNHNRFIGEYVGKVYSVGFAVRKTLTAEEPTYNVTYLRNAAYYTDKGSVTTAPSKEVAYTASLDTKVSFGSNFCVNYYAVRLYNMPLSEAQMRQNHLADLMGFFDIPLDAYLALPEDARQAVNNGAASISLSDEKGADALNALIKNALRQSLYVSDVDGDDESDLKFFFDAYGKKAGDSVTATIVDHLGNSYTVPAGAVYNDDALCLNGAILNLTPYYDPTEDIYLDMVLAQTGVRHGTKGAAYFGPTGAITMSTNNSDTDDTRPVNESFGLVSGTYWGGSNWGTDVSWSQIHFIGNYIGKLYTIGVAVKKDMKAMTYQLSYVRDGATVKGPSDAKAIGSDTSIKFGEILGLNYYAIRLYSKVLSKEQIDQNHFADLINYLNLSIDDYLALSAEARAYVAASLSSLTLSDEEAERKIERAIEKAKEVERVKALYALYVSDTDGDGVSNATLLWDAFDKTAEDAVSESAFKPSASAYYGDGFLYNNAEQIDLTAYLPNFNYGGQTAQKDYTLELAMSTCAATDEGTGNNGSAYWYFGNFYGQFYFRQKDNADLAKNGPALAYFPAGNGAFKETGKNIDFNLNKNYNYWFGTKAEESYTSAIAFDFTLGETPNKDVDTMTFAFYNDATRLEHTRLDGTLPYDAAKTSDSLKLGNKVKLNYYAIRIYDDLLTVEEMRQNHFADLAVYAGIDNVATFKLLTEASKQALYEAFNQVRLTDGRDVNKARLESAIDAAYASERGVSAEDYISFLGYEVRLTGNVPGLRSLYEVKKTAIDASVLEVGAIMAIENGRTVDMLTQNGGAAMLSHAVYADGAWEADKIFTRQDGAQNLFAYTTMYDSEFATTQYACAMLYRAYVTLTLDGVTVTLYADMTDSFDSVSLTSVTEALVAQNANLKNYATVSSVLSAKGE